MHDAAPASPLPSRTGRAKGWRYISDCVGSLCRVDPTVRNASPSTEQTRPSTHSTTRAVNRKTSAAARARENVALPGKTSATRRVGLDTPGTSTAAASRVAVHSQQHQQQHISSSPVAAATHTTALTPARTHASIDTLSLGGLAAAAALRLRLAACGGVVVGLMSQSPDPRLPAPTPPRAAAAAAACCLTTIAFALRRPRSADSSSRPGVVPSARVPDPA